MSASGLTRILNSPHQPRAISDPGEDRISGISSALRELVIAVSASLLAGSGAIIALIVVRVGS
jgi:hypothetical protein